METIWADLRSNQLSDRVFDNSDAIVDACCHAWDWLTAQPERISSIASGPRAQVNQ